jgi:hypothetical protein
MKQHDDLDRSIHYMNSTSKIHKRDPGIRAAMSSHLHEHHYAPLAMTALTSKREEMPTERSMSEKRRVKEPEEMPPRNI